LTFLHIVASSDNPAAAWLVIASAFPGRQLATPAAALTKKPKVTLSPIARKAFPSA
jgi:hypothetical protein